MKSEVELIPVEFICAECHHEWPALAGVLFEQHPIRCPACGAEREVDVTELKKTIGAEVQACLEHHIDSP